MKSTGVIRRIDELGRIVIPKEIRRHLGIREGENIEIYIEENKIVLKKYSKILEYSDISKKICEIVPSTMNLGILITDRDKIITSSNNVLENFENFDINLNNKLIDYIRNRESYESVLKEKLEINDKYIEGYFYIMPIISSIDCLGLIILVKNEVFVKEEKLFCKFIAQMIANKIDIS